MVDLDKELGNRQRHPYKQGFYRLLDECVCYVNGQGRVELSDGTTHDDVPCGLIPLEIEPQKEIEDLRGQASFIERLLKEEE